MAATKAAAFLGSQQCLPAKTGIVVPLSKGQLFQVINTHGKQVVDIWAFDSQDPTSHLSMEHTRASLLRISIGIGDTLVSNRRTPILTLVADTSPGVHDLLIAACDSHRYAQLGVKEYHVSCVDNLHKALKALGTSIRSVPSPLNLFMNVPVASDGSLSFAEPVCEAGQSCTLRAETDLILVMSACPQDVTPVNGGACADIHFAVT